MMIIGSVIHGQPPSVLLNPAQVERASTYNPILFLENGPGDDTE